jgi:tetratricopeptide (TPR) repeat protein
MLGNYIAFTSLVFAVVGLLAGYLGFKRAATIAKEQAENWFNQNEKGLQERLEQLQTKVSEVENAATIAKSHFEKTQAAVDDAGKATIERMEQAEAQIAKGEKLTAENIIAVQTDTELLENKPLNEWTAEDFYRDGVYRYTLGNYELALSRWDAVISMLGNSQEPVLQKRVAMALFNKGITLGQLNQSQEEIAVYDELIHRFGDSKELTLQEQVTKALFNKGVRLGKLNQSKEEIAVYDELVRRFGDSKEPALQEQVTKALVNKGVRLGKLNQSKEAIAVYDDVISRFGDSQESVLQEVVANAKQLKEIL